MSKFDELYNRLMINEDGLTRQERIDAIKSMPVFANRLVYRFRKQTTVYGYPDDYLVEGQPSKDALMSLRNKENTIAFLNKHWMTRPGQTDIDAIHLAEGDSTLPGFSIASKTYSPCWDITLIYIDYERKVVALGQDDDGWDVTEEQLEPLGIFFE